LPKVVAAAAALSMLVAACSSSKKSNSSLGSSTTAAPAGVSGTGTGPAPGSVNIGYAGGYSLSFLPVIVAQGSGFLADVGTRFNTSVKFDVYGGGTQAEPAFLGGTDQFMVIGSNSWVPAVLQGKDQVGVFSEQESVGIVMAAANKVKDSKGTDLAKFDGATWCQTGPVGTAHTAIALAVQKAGLKIEKQKIVSVGSVSAYTPALQAGRCDINSEDTTSAATQELQNVGYVVANYVDPTVSAALAGHIIGIPLTTSSSFAAKYPELTQAIVDATLKGLQFISLNVNNPSAIYAKLPSDMQKQITPELFNKAFTYYGAGYSMNQNAAMFTQQAATDTIALLKATNGIDPSAVPDPSKLWTNRFVIQAYKDLATSPQTGAATGPAILSPTLGKPTVDFTQLASQTPATTAPPTTAATSSTT
jgi:ABC-type nitrate/sulfonate/bicarbonate transport system substrate-binding protein